MAEAEDVQSVFKVLAIPVDMPVILQPVCDSEDNDEKQNVYANNNMLTDKTDAGIDESEPPSATTYYLKCQPEHVDGVEVSNFYHQVGGRQRPTPVHSYIPNDFFLLSVLMVAMACCSFAFLHSLVCSVPALMFSHKSKNNAYRGQIKNARKQGMIAGYLNFVAMLVILFTIIFYVGMVIGIPQYSINFNTSK